MKNIENEPNGKREFFPSGLINDNLKMTALVNGFSLFKIPLLAFCLPQIVECSDKKSEVKIKLGWRTRNHLNVMYFGALAIGAELSIASMALKEIRNSGKRIDFIFKDFSCRFLKRADGHVRFIFEDTKGVIELIQQAANSPDRQERTFIGSAFVEGNLNEPVMTYQLTLSVKNRSKK